MGRRIRAAALFAVVLLAALAIEAQRGRFPQFPDSEDESDFVFPKNAEFHFVRTEYTDLPQRRRGFGFVSRRGRANGWWAQDWPDADNHFTNGVQRLTRIDTGEPVHLPLTDDRVFDYPWIYATQTAYWDLSQAETDRLREYLMRGGFLVVDDFWGPEEWEYFREVMQRVLPNQEIHDLLETDSVMHVLYDIQEKDRTFIPGSRHLYRGAGGSVEVVQPAGTSPAWQALYDDKKRMVVAINFNTDVGDAWEFADAPYYPAAMTMLAYRYGINYLVYAMTH
jgi:Domain of unknown function (DUF4159)